MKKLLLTLLVAGASTTGLSQTYLCITEAAGGIGWNDVKGKWEGGKYPTNRKYLIKPPGDFSSRITWWSFETDTPYAGCDWGTSEDEKNLLTCDGSMFVRYSRETKRFTSYYKYGYVSGKNNNDDTPVVEAGICSKID